MSATLAETKRATTEEIRNLLIVIDVLIVFEIIINHILVLFLVTGNLAYKLANHISIILLMSILRTWGLGFRV